MTGVTFLAFAIVGGVGCIFAAIAAAEVAGAIVEWMWERW